MGRLLMSWIKRITKLEKTGMKILSYKSKSPLSVLRKFKGILESDTKKINIRP